MDSGRARELTARRRTGRPPTKVVLLVIAIVNVLGCLVGAWGLAAGGPAMFGTDLLAGTAFAGQYGLAAFLLGGVVGGTQAVAAVLELRHNRWSVLAHAVAGAAMVVWIYGEVSVVGGGAFLQHLYFAVGLLQLGLVLVTLGILAPARPMGSPEA